jgi:hypothetical protein
LGHWKPRPLIVDIGENGDVDTVAETAQNIWSELMARRRHHMVDRPR